ncbi:putative inorganic phosphate cotransporter [Schistocerca cancellata]|uniref:putative inorganic phosphate cotransporter n=1 Tax=Schistocerca cancellata TaxID=274614 RepID=UPI0021190220|nr:putative inorganic phosphate cotransporter [Schistocerca cancellata]
MCPLDIEKIDMEILIMEVEKRPCIWDVRTEEYKDRNKKVAAWHEICCALFDDFADHSSTEKKSVGVPTLGVRHLQALLLCIAHVLVFCLRTDMSVAVVVMANNTAGNPNIKGYSLEQALADLQKSDSDNELIFGNEDDSDVDGDMIDEDDYGWSQSETSTILSSFFWGYVVMLAPAGWVADRFDAKNLLSASLILSGILTMITEVAADTGGVVLVCAFRVVMGLSQGFVYPCTHSLLAKWIPPKENYVLGTAVYTGDQLGTVVAMVISGALAQSAVGWPSIFYFFGGLSILWGVMIFWLGGNTPSGHKHISRAELTYIEESRKDVSRERKNGLLSALPYVVNCVLSLSFSWIVNSVQKKLIFNKGALRKVANSIASWLPAATLVALSFIPVEDPTAAVILLTVAIGFNGMTIMGYQMNHIDIAPNFSGLMIGICGSIGTLTSIAAPLYVGAVGKENSTATYFGMHLQERAAAAVKAS